MSKRNHRTQYTKELPTGSYRLEPSGVTIRSARVAAAMQAKRRKLCSSALQKASPGELIWEKAKPMRSKAPGEYRTGPYGHDVHYARTPEPETAPLRRATNLNKSGRIMKEWQHSKSR